MLGVFEGVVLACSSTDVVVDFDKFIDRAVSVSDGVTVTVDVMNDTVVEV